MDTQDTTNWTYDAEDQRLFETRQCFAIRIDGIIDHAHIYPLNSQEILDLLQKSRASSNVYTRNEVHTRILQALVQDSTDPDPDAVRCWLDHHIVYGEPTMALAEQMVRALNREESARAQAQEWLAQERQADEWLQAEDAAVLHPDVCFTCFILRSLMCVTAGLLLCLLAATLPAPWCWVPVVVGALLVALDIWRNRAVAQLQTQEEE
jgi:hypothetical protein